MVFIHILSVTRYETSYLYCVVLVGILFPSSRTAEQMKTHRTAHFFFAHSKPVIMPWNPLKLRIFLHQVFPLNTDKQRLCGSQNVMIPIPSFVLYYHFVCVCYNLMLFAFFIFCNRRIHFVLPVWTLSFWAFPLLLHLM